MSEEQEVMPEQTGVVPAPTPVNVTVDTPEPATAPVTLPSPDKIETDLVTHELDIDGRVETVNDDEYKYLAKLGAQSLIAAQYNQHENPEAPAGEEPVEEDIAYEADPEGIQRRMSNLEQQVYNQRLSGQVDNLKRDVEKWISHNDTMQSIGVMENGTQLLNEVRKEIYNKCSQENMAAPKAFEVVAHKWSQIMGTDRTDYLMKKLREKNEAQPVGGGAPPPAPTKAFTGRDWGDGSMIQSISERLTSSES